MELKFIWADRHHYTLWGSNRTFMELKLLTYEVRKFATWVLIAPLWN